MSDTRYRLRNRKSQDREKFYQWTNPEKTQQGLQKPPKNQTKRGRSNNKGVVILQIRERCNGVLQLATIEMRTIVRGPLGPEIKVGVPLKRAVKRQLNIVALTPRITAWGMNRFPERKSLSCRIRWP